MIRKFGKDINITLASCAFGLRPGEEGNMARHMEAALKAGFDGFEISQIYGLPQADKLFAAVKSFPARIFAVHGILGGGSFSADKAERERAAEDAFRYLETFAEYAPCPIVEHFWSRFNDPERGAYFRETAAILLEKTERCGFVFCMENAPYNPEEYERYPRVAEVADFARSFGKDRMFMTFDVNHANLHEDVIEAVSDCGGLIRHIHVSDNHGRREEHLVPGAGIIDLKAVIRKIYETGYSGPCNFEFGFPKGHVPGLQDYQQVYNFIKNQLLECPAATA